MNTSQSLGDEGVAKPGQYLLDELKHIHRKIRHDLEVCRELALAVSDGAPAEEIRDQVRNLQTRGPLWRLKATCIYHCRLVHAHHGAEDGMLFPRLRASNPDMGSVVDKLEADHRAVSDLLDEVEAATRGLVAEDLDHTRDRLVLALDKLAADLFVHLDYEERSIGPALLELDGWVM